VADEALARWAQESAMPGSLRVLDCAYAPLRLHGQNAAPPADAWQLWTPNKALGLTGVRAAYAIAPDARQAAAVGALAPSWPLGTDGVALLHAWVGDAAQDWLAASLVTLRRWKAAQIRLCESLGWAVLPGSLANYFTARLPVADMSAALHALRAHGVKLRDCASFGLPGHARLGVLAPASRRALRAAWLAWRSAA
jgi:histidinol-phosphate aminotransferase